LRVDTTPRCLTVLTPILPGKDAALRARLRAIGDDINGSRLSTGTRPDMAFVRSRRIHFARFAILNDPDRGPGRTRLLFASVYDGRLDEHLDELISITSDMDAIWGACEGYTGVNGFQSFIRAHACDTDAYYVAFRDESAASITSAIAARRRRHAVQDSHTPNVGERTNAPTATDSRSPFRSVVAALRRVLRAAPLVTDVVRAVAQNGFGNVYHGTLRITASLDRYPLFRVLNWITRNRIPPRKSEFSSVPIDQRSAFAPMVTGDEIPAEWTAVAPAFREDAVAQNQLTLVTVVDPAAVGRVRAVLAAIDSYARRLSPPGSLIGISTIHFVRWLLIDHDRRLLFISDYDGSWESYIDEFAEMILSGLDAIWETSYGMPPDGARDFPAFKRFLRSHQVPSDVFFAAYPDSTVLNIIADREQ
jgi:hypothetical protein